MTDKICVITNAFQEKKLIKECIEQFKPFDLFHYIMAPDYSWNGNLEQDETPQIAKELGAFVVQGQWESAKDQFNYGLTLAGDHEWAIICDADERYEEKEIEYLLEILSHSINAGALRTNSWDVYWKNSDYRIIPEQTDYPIIAVRTKERMQNIRNPHAETWWCDVHMHHFSYVRNDEDMLKKIKTFEAAKEFQVMDWYNNIWLKWTPEMENLHPVNPPQFKKAVYSPMPEGIKL